MFIHIKCEVNSVDTAATPNALAVAAMFGLALPGRERLEIVPEIALPVIAGEIVLITGPSGSGKSTILRALAKRLEEGGRPVWDLQKSPLPAAGTLVDAFGDLPLEQALAHLARAGLADAFVLLRRPEELSDGQRFRFRLAQWFASSAPVLLADEFAATLDRVTAKILSHQVRKFVTASRGSAIPRTAILATTHDDLQPDLLPDVRVIKSLGRSCEVLTQENVKCER